MDAERGQKPERWIKRQRARLLQQSQPREAGAEGPSAQAKDRERRSAAKVLLRKDVWNEEETYEFQDRQGPEQSYKQEP